MLLGPLGILLGNMVGSLVRDLLNGECANTMRGNLVMASIAGFAGFVTTKLEVTSDLAQILVGFVASMATSVFLVAFG